MHVCICPPGDREARARARRAQPLLSYPLVPSIATRVLHRTTKQTNTHNHTYNTATCEAPSGASAVPGAAIDAEISQTLE